MSDKGLDRAVVLAAGRGSRMSRESGRDEEVCDEVRRLAARGLKGLIPVGGRPFLDYTVSRLAEAGIRQVCFVVAAQAEEMRRYGAGVRERFGLEVGFAVQHEPLGTADAVLSCEELVGGEDFLLCNCDNLYPGAALSALISLPAGSCAVAGFNRDVLVEEGNFSRERIASFSVIRMGPQGQPADIIEKPQDPERYEYEGAVWVNMNLYRLTSAIFQACRSLQPHPERGELELTEAASSLMNSPEADFSAVFCSGPVYDMTGREDIASVQKALEDRSGR